MALRTTITGLVSRIARLPAASSSAAGPALISPQCSCIHTQTSPLLFHVTNQRWGAPMKKKKKLDPAVVMARENKRKKKIEKQMKRLERLGRSLKPVEEIVGDLKIRRELEMRTRPAVDLEFEELERRALLHKDWARVKMRQHKQESMVWAQLVSAQQTALEELRFESEPLYQMAIERDETLIPLEFKGPTATPAIKDYVAPDGEYIDITKTYD